MVDARTDTALYPRPVKRLEMGAPVKSVLHATGGYLLRGGDTVAMEMQRAFLSPAAEGAEGAYFLFDLGREEVGCPPSGYPAPRKPPCASVTGNIWRTCGPAPG